MTIRSKVFLTSFLVVSLPSAFGQAVPDRIHSGNRTSQVPSDPVNPNGGEVEKLNKIIATQKELISIYEKKIKDLNSDIEKLKAEIEELKSKPPQSEKKQ